MTKPSADCSSDYKTLVTNLKLKLRKPVKATTRLGATPTPPAALFHAEDHTYTYLQPAATLDTNRKLDNKRCPDVCNKRSSWQAKHWMSPNSTFLYANRWKNPNVVSSRRQRLSGASITTTGWCEAEIWRRPPIARTATTKLNNIWRDSATTQNTKLRLLNFLMFLIVSYASETWTVREADKRRLDTFEIKNVSILDELNGRVCP